MLDLRDRVELAEGVVVEAGAVHDTVLGGRRPGNAAAMVVLSQLGGTIEEAAVALTRAFGITLEQARDDALAFVWDLNRALLVNVHRGRGRLESAIGWALLAIRLAPAGVLPAPVARRYPLETVTWPRVIATCCSALVRRVVVIAVTVTVVVEHLVLIAGGGSSGTAITVGSASALGLLTHEMAHAAMLRGIPAALVTAGLRTYVSHPVVLPARRTAVAIGGPLAPTVIGVLLASVSLQVGSPCLALAAFPLACHALSLTVIGSDGRVACGL